MSCDEAAARYLAKGWTPVPIPRGLKGPIFEGWQNFKPNGETHYPNTGMLLGEKSNNVVDVDIDCAEALRLADDILPATAAVFGRASKRRAHRLYRCVPPPEKTVQFQFGKPPDMLVELRSTGGQTMMPPSLHPDGEIVEWDEESDPHEIAAADLLRYVSELAGLSLLLRNWPEPRARYNAEGALIGAMLRAGRSEDEVQRTIELIQREKGAARDHKPSKSVPRLAKMLAEGKPVPGLRRLAEIFGTDVASRVADWLRLRPRGRIYEERDASIIFNSVDKDGVITPVPLCNFTAYIAAVIERDDGSGIVTRDFLVRGSPGEVEVAAGEFDAMAWVTAEWGPWARIAPGRTLKDHLAAAIKSFSDEAERRVVYTHTGWRKVDGELLYLHAGGAIGQDGPVEGVEVDLGDRLAGLLLLPGGNVDDVRAALDIIHLNTTVAAAAFRAPINEFCLVAFSVLAEGKTGTFKSAVTGVGQAFWGPGWDGTKFAANWSGTANSLEKMAFIAKDCLLVVDDFAPRGSRGEVNAMHRKAEELLRSVGNQGGRSRMAADTSLRTTYSPRGLLVSSGEDLPAGHSLRARLAVERFDKDTVNIEVLTQLQRIAREGALSRAMAQYVQWLACVEDLAAKLKTNRQVFWKEVPETAHLRTRTITADLVLGIDTFLQFAKHIGAIDDDERLRLREKACTALYAGVKTQKEAQQEEDPCEVFLEALPAVLAACRAHLTDRHGDKPADDPTSLGWRPNGKVASGDREIDVFARQGKCIGWFVPEYTLAGGEIWLMPDAALSEIGAMLRDAGRTIPVIKNTLARRLIEAGVLRPDEKTGSATKVVNIAGTSQRVWALIADRVLKVTA